MLEKITLAGGAITLNIISSFVQFSDTFSSFRTFLIENDQIGGSASESEISGRKFWGQVHDSARWEVEVFPTLL